MALTLELTRSEAELIVDMLERGDYPESDMHIALPLLEMLRIEYGMTKPAVFDRSEWVPLLEMIGAKSW